MNWLAELRQNAGILTQSDLASRLQLHGFDYSPGAISHWENGTRNPPLDNGEFRKTLAYVLRISEIDLLRRAGYGVDVNHSQAGERAAFIVDQLDPHTQKIMLRILEQFLNDKDTTPIP